EIAFERSPRCSARDNVAASASALSAATPRGNAAEQLEVRTGAEAAPRAREHDAHHRGVGNGAIHGVADLTVHGARPRVERFGPIQRDGGDRVIDLIQDLVVHRCSSLAFQLTLLSSYSRGMTETSFERPARRFLHVCYCCPDAGEATDFF